MGINRFIGRRPILAFGNSDGDLQMLQYAAAGAGPRLALILHHTDGGREWAYDRNSSFGQLDEGRTRGVDDRRHEGGLEDGVPLEPVIMRKSQPLNRH